MITELSDRFLWYDGDSTVKSSDILQMATSGKSIAGLYVEEISNDIATYNRFVPEEDKIKIKKKVRPVSFDWNIPQEFKELNVVEYLTDKLDDVISTEQLNDDEVDIRAKRTMQEIKLFKQFGLMDILRTIIYVIETFKTKNVVWGVGRGSSVSSYVLYLIGVHDIDSVQYDLDIRDFLHEG